MIRFCLAAAMSIATGVAAAHPAMTAEPATMRAAPSSHARVVQRIPPHAQIDLGECGDRWCAASWRDLDGYVRVETIAASDGGPLVAAPPRTYYSDYGGPYSYGGSAVVGPVFGFGYYQHW